MKVGFGNWPLFTIRQRFAWLVPSNLSISFSFNMRRSADLFPPSISNPASGGDATSGLSFTATGGFFDPVSAGRFFVFLIISILLLGVSLEFSLISFLLAVVVVPPLPDALGARRISGNAADLENLQRL
jgi:hypothetical protein